ALHGALAVAIETLDSEKTVEQAPLLAHHYARSGQPEKAIEFAMRAGEYSGQMHARAEAAIHYGQALTIAQEMADSAGAQRGQIDAIVKIASISGDSRAEVERDQKYLPQAETMARALEDRPRLAQVLYWLGRVHYAHGDKTVAADYAEQSLATADSLGDEALAAPPVNLLGRYYSLQGNVSRASELLTRNVEQMRRLGDAEEATAAGSAGLSFAWKGEFGRALTYLDRSLTLAQQFQNPFAEAAAHFYRGIFHVQRGAWAKAIDDYNKAIEISETVEDSFRIYLSKSGIGEALVESGHPDRARQMLEDAVGFAEKVGTGFCLSVAKRSLASALWVMGEHDRALSVCQEAIVLGHENDELLFKSRACQLMGSFLRQSDPSAGSQADQLIREAIAIQKEFGAEPELARSYLAHAKSLFQQGEPIEAKRYTHQAREMFVRLGMEWDLLQVDRPHNQ
ncbi:MAG: tetratricopeptide repeat protein, partial [Burkholderiaceae bacterium]